LHASEKEIESPPLYCKKCKTKISAHDFRKRKRVIRRSKQPFFIGKSIFFLPLPLLSNEAFSA
jgi:hypothetical protein